MTKYILYKICTSVCVYVCVCVFANADLFLTFDIMASLDESVGYFLIMHHFGEPHFIMIIESPIHTIN